MELKDLRTQIDAVDDGVLRLFKERMDASRQIAEYKMMEGLPVLDAAREQEKLAAIGAKAGDEMRPYALELFQTLFELSRAYQERLLNSGSEKQSNTDFEPGRAYQERLLNSGPEKQSNTDARLASLCPEGLPDDLSERGRK